MSSMHFPESPRSFFSDLTGSPPKLDPNTLALLNAFLNEKADEERRFQEIASEGAAAQIAGLALEVDEVEKPMVSVADFRLAFGEDWQLSQFWYTDTFANKLAEALHSLCNSTTKVVFMCCPTAFVAFQHMKRSDNAMLLEYDQRFAVLSPKQFVPYDIDEPDVFPESLKGSVELAVVDPPFLNEVTNRKVVQTLRQILHPIKGKLFIMTSTSVEDVLYKLYDCPPLGPLKKTSMKIEHDRLSNDFASWGSWDGAENFGDSK